MQGSCCAAKPDKVKTDYRAKMRLYQPLMVIVSLSAGVAAALSFQGVPVMNGLMGAFLVFLSALKLFNLPAFAESFARYDIVAARSRAYAVAYPFIELGLGLLYFSGRFPVFTNIMTVIVMAVGTAGVARVIRSRTEVKCACVGTGFNLPVGYVTVAENLAMLFMAAAALAEIHI